MSQRKELAALKNLISETDQILAATPELPENRTARCRELVRSALALTDDLLSESKQFAPTALGRKGGSVIAKRGSDFFRKLDARRKTHGGGRPRTRRRTDKELNSKTDGDQVALHCEVKYGGRKEGNAGRCAKT